MASIIRIKRSSVAGNPGTLAAGELAYSALPWTLVNTGGDKLYIGMGTETSGNAANHIVIGGLYYTSLVDAGGTGGSLNTAAKSIPVLSSTGAIDKWYVGNVYTTDNTIATTNSNGNLILDPHGSGMVKIANTWTLPRSAGTPNYILTTDGNGTASWTAPPSTNTSNSLTFNNDGSGTASGSTFNGSSAVTVSYNTVGAAPAAGSSNITTVGTITSGSWQSSTPIGVAYGGTGTITGSISGTGALTFTAGGTNNNINLVAQGTGTVDVASKRITSVAEPTSPQDAATKAYVDAAVASLHIHDSCNVATTDDLATLTGGTIAYDNGTSGYNATLVLSGSPTKNFTAAGAFDTGFTAVAGNRVLIKNQTTQLQNGIYVVTSATVLTRATDFDSTAEAAGGDFVFVMSGGTNADTGWVQTHDNPTVGTDAITWTQFSGAGNITAGDGLTQSGSTINVVGTANRISVSADAIDISTSYVGQTTITTLGTITTGTWNSSTPIGATYGGTGFTSYATGDLVYASATNTLSKLTAGSDGKVLQLVSGVPSWGDIDGGTY